MLDGDGERIEKDEQDDEPVEPLLFHRFSNPESNLKGNLLISRHQSQIHAPIGNHLLLVHPEVRVFLELFLQSQTGRFFLLQKFCNKGSRIINSFAIG